MRLVQPARHDIVVQPQNRTRRLRGLSEDQLAGGLHDQRAQMIADQRLAVAMHLVDFVGRADRQIRLFLAIGLRPCREVIEGFHDRARLHVGDLPEDILQAVAIGQKRFAGLPLFIGPLTAIFLFQRQQQRDQRQFDAGENVGGIGADFGAIVDGGLNALFHAACATFSSSILA